MKSKLTIIDAFTLPFESYSRTWMWLWLLLPIVGWFVYLGYLQTVLQAFIKGKYNGLPAINSFQDNFVSGWWFFVFLFTVSIISMVLSMLPHVGLILTILWNFIMTMMTMQYVEKEDFRKGWDVAKAVNLITNDFGAFILMILKSAGVGLLYLLAMIPLITIPFMIGPISFARHVLAAEFYKNHK